MALLKLKQEPVWVYPKHNPKWRDAIIDEFQIHPVTAQVLVSRGFETFDEIHDFLYAKLPNLHDPYLFADMDKAVERILQALKNKENVLIYGDNDVDGITGATLLTDFLRSLGINTFFYVPNRNSPKSHLILDAMEFALSNNCKLLITVDCGITAAKEIKEFTQKSIDVIVTDHHEPTAKIPHCVATLNPKLVGSTYPNRELTGVGVAFKLIHALTNDLTSKGEISAGEIDLKRYLDLVALGTIADMGALNGENRILVRYGLRQLSQSKRVGLVKLLHVCEVTSATVTTNDIASKVAPRLNSLGRIADPIKGVELLLISDPLAAEKLATELDLNNIERQKIERRDSEDVEAYILKHPEILEDRAIVLSSNKWHPGIIPIITARIAKQYNRPTIVIAIDNGVGKGSIRTIPEFPLLPALRDSAEYLINFGGHDFAAGLTIQEELIPAFTKEFIGAANKQLKIKDVLPKLSLDAEVSFQDLTYDFMESLHLLEPFGTGNPAPILHCSATQVWQPKVVGKTHLKLYLEQNERTLEGIGFGMGEKKADLGKKGTPLKIAFTPQINTFLNKTSIQLQIRDVKVDQAKLSQPKKAAKAK